MTTSEKKQLVVTFIKLMTSGRSDQFGQVLAETYHQHNPDVKDGLAGIQERTKQFESVFADMSVTIDDLVVEDDKVVGRFTWTGTHIGPFLGIPPTHKRVSWSGTDWWRIEDGNLAEHWDNVDWASLVQQLQSPKA